MIITAFVLEFIIRQQPKQRIWEADDRASVPRKSKGSALQTHDSGQLQVNE